MAAAPEAGTAGADGALAAGAGVACVAAWRSNTLVPSVVLKLPKYANARVAQKNTVANTAVLRDMKFALPEAPKRLPEPPLPNAAPISAPLPCCMRIKPIITRADNI